MDELAARRKPALDPGKRRAWLVTATDTRTGGRSGSDFMFTEDEAQAYAEGWRKEPGWADVQVEEYPCGL